MISIFMSTRMTMFAHVHLHFHEPGTQHAGPVKSHSHAIRQVGFKPVLVGAFTGWQVRLRLRCWS